MDAPNAAWLDGLDGLPDEQMDYVPELVQRRLDGLRHLPIGARGIVQGCTGRILDVGTGEGVSSMALAQFVPKAQVHGVDMDWDHVKCAWPMCRGFHNLRLAWGAVPGTPSNPNVKAGDLIVPAMEIPLSYYDVLFSWTGMSRRDVFGGAATWSAFVRYACVIVIPRIWREEMSPAHPAYRQLSQLCAGLGTANPAWPAAGELQGFSKVEYYPLSETKSASSWVLWLTGVFDGAGVTFWDTLTDRGRYGLDSLRLDMDVVVGVKSANDLRSL